MADQVEEIKQKADIVSVVAERIELKKAGRNYKAVCPFHSEKTPSFMVSPELQIYKCFGCGAAGDVISFLEKYEGMDFYEALKYLADKTGVKLIASDFGESREKDNFFALNKLAARFYNYILLSHPSAKSALDYLVNSRFLDKPTIETFQIGYAPENPNYFKNFFITKKGYKSSELEAVGLSYGRGSFVQDRFAGRITFPLLDHRGNVVGFSGRLLPSVEKKDVGKYINTPETMLYHKSNLLYGLNLTKKDIKEKDQAIVVEGELDVISPWRKGIKNIVAIKGSSLTLEQAKLISRFSNNIVLALDSDSAGNLAARRGIEIAEVAGLRVRVAALTKYKDPDEAAVKDINSFKKVIASSVSIWDFIIDLSFSKHTGSGGEAKAEISRELIPVLAKIEDEIVQAHYVSEVARRLNVPDEAVFRQVTKAKESQDIGFSQVTPLETEKTERREILEEKLLALFFLKGKKFSGIKDDKKLIKTPLITRIIEEFEKFTKTYDKYSLGAFSKFLPDELRERFSDSILKTSLENEDVVPDKIIKELELIRKEIKLLNFREEQEELLRQIKEYERLGQHAKVKEGEIHLNEILKKRSEFDEEFN
ncbi:DNA primase [Candidatus Woesebacteria bacterium RIFCSPLOWO2_01_FULL_39_23]|uniref:DNA primase n=1 Tax=Candidatus Woesebacteria bacterium RIFCSPHIGHO2_01_FULL_40_22 TaxID=1802499 RepID=A0A1F7YIP3_9BACT|nr:MAG: DNA primase [Candidatus Woesebacteria bacterium RBG_16_40_11]OGM26405.1 MAG: DNA primase [Candidatus Woesebacteria bacterium RIFCSPHIGHO2_01_FULL_40_22]OGM36037.1 MAG: DNA primase [Candidatus Woesebacteria bacterium RIFCSPHIGHO2_12_FULL_38_9]OGM61988.1 MAG: DNA primase [Candidatus Woesebacteria bacterium RIFCSPLOWO2_01_FULL_39_23]